MLCPSQLWGWGSGFASQRKAGRSGYLPKHWNIAAFRQLNHQRIALALTQEILAQPRPEPTRFGPHDRILLGIVIQRAPKDFDRNQGFLQFGVPPLQVPLHYEPQKPGQALVARETGTLQDSFQLPPSSLPLRFDRWHWFENTSYFQSHARGITPAPTL